MMGPNGAGKTTAFNAIGGFAIGLLAVLWRNPIVALLAGGFGGSTVGAYYLALTRGMFGFKEVRGGMAQQVAEIAEWIGIATGGLAAVVLPETNVIDRVDPDLTLHGLRFLYELNADRLPEVAVPQASSAADGGDGLS